MGRHGERRAEILRTLADMLTQPRAEKITTATLAARLGLAESALYRHYASKARMFEALVADLAVQLRRAMQESAAGRTGLAQVEFGLAALLDFAGTHPGLCRVLTGEALAHEEAYLMFSVHELVVSLEGEIAQRLTHALAVGEAAPGLDAQAAARLLMAGVQGHWLRFAQSGFADDPLSTWALEWPLLKAGLVAGATVPTRTGSALAPPVQ